MRKSEDDASHKCGKEKNIKKNVLNLNERTLRKNKI